MGGNGWWAGWVLMDGGTARPDVKRRVTRAAPLARQERVLPTDGKLLLSVPWDYVPSSWSVDDGYYGTTASCGSLKYGTKARSWCASICFCLTRFGADLSYNGRVPARGDYSR